MTQRHIIPPAELLTGRLLLRTPVRGDARAVFEGYAQDPDVTRHLAWAPHRRIADSRAFLERIERARNAMAEHTWSIVLRGTGAMIGMISLRISPPGAEFGFVVAKSFWNNGYATEAARAVLEWALSQESIRRVSAVCEVGNAASARVLEKLGAQRKGTLRRWMRHAGSDIPQDCHCYATLKEDLVQ